MSYPSITLVNLDSLVDKCMQYHPIVYVPTAEQVRYEDHQRYLELLQEETVAYQRSVIRSYDVIDPLDAYEWAHPDSVDQSIPTGDSALDDSDSELDIDEIVYDPEYSDSDEVFEEMTDVSEDDEPIYYDPNDQININDLYN